MNYPLLKEMITSVARECAMRKNVYPKWVAQGRMTQEKADREKYLMEQVKLLLQAIYEGSLKESVQLKLGE